MKRHSPKEFKWCSVVNAACVILQCNPAEYAGVATRGGCLFSRPVACRIINAHSQDNAGGGLSADAAQAVQDLQEEVGAVQNHGAFTECPSGATPFRRPLEKELFL